MRTAIVLGLLLIGQVVGGTAWAGECPPGTTLQKIGTVVTANDTAAGGTAGGDVISSSGQLIRAVRVSCGSACTATLYDSDGETGTTTAAEVVDEPGAPANESRWYAYDPPLSVSTGLWFNDDGNVNAVIAYNCR